MYVKTYATNIENKAAEELSKCCTNLNNILYEIFML